MNILAELASHDFTDPSNRTCLILAVLGFLFWALTYAFIIHKSWVDRTFGVPWQNICLNITWELFFVFVCPSWQQAACTYCPGFACKLKCLPPSFHVCLIAALLLVWFLLDLIIFSQLVVFGPREQQGAMKKYFLGIIVISLGLAFACQMTFVTYFGDTNGLGLAWIIDLVMSLLFISLFYQRPDGRGLSYPAAWTRMLGDASQGICFGLFTMPTGVRDPSAFLILVSTLTVLADGYYVYLMTRRRQMMKHQGSPEVGRAVAGRRLAREA